jgi:hypothetical protein
MQGSGWMGQAHLKSPTTKAECETAQTKTTDHLG